MGRGGVGRGQGGRGAPTCVLRERDVTDERGSEWWCGCSCCPYPPAQCSGTNPPARHVLTHSCGRRLADSQRGARRHPEDGDGDHLWAFCLVVVRGVETTDKFWGRLGRGAGGVQEQSSRLELIGQKKKSGDRTYIPERFGR